MAAYSVKSHKSVGVNLNSCHTDAACRSPNMNKWLVKILHWYMIYA